MKVRNINGTTPHACRCGSWLDHWKRFSGRYSTPQCSKLFCYKMAEVGAHVQKDSDLDRNWYIVPLCRQHNALTNQSIDIWDDVQLIHANVSDTCGK